MRQKKTNAWSEQHYQHMVHTSYPRRLFELRLVGYLENLQIFFSALIDFVCLLYAQTQNVLHAIRIYFPISFMPRFIVEGYFSLSANSFYFLPHSSLYRKLKEYERKMCIYKKWRDQNTLVLLCCYYMPFKLKNKMMRRKLIEVKKNTERRKNIKYEFYMRDRVRAKVA